MEPLAKRFILLGAVPTKAVEDIFHIAVATVQQMNYLLTSWNRKHLANPHRRSAIE